ncbi:MAG: hypothetical protein WCT34_01830 [Patescibacteria group bacterium]|jgi:hypothetical protein
MFVPFFYPRSERKQPVAKNGGDGEGGLHFERRADYLPETIILIVASDQKERATIFKPTDDSFLEEKDNVV